LTLPAKFNTPFAFEIENQNNHSNGYNPEDIDSILEGQIVFSNSDKDYCGW
jgi:hypothetical protein